jgi:hypothetical protein
MRLVWSLLAGRKTGKIIARKKKLWSSEARERLASRPMARGTHDLEVMGRLVAEAETHPGTRRELVFYER